MSRSLSQRLTIGLVGLVVLFSLPAQALEWQGVSLGIKGGASWSAFTGDGNFQFKEDLRNSPGVTSFDPDMLVMATGDLFLTIFLYDGALAFQPEAQYIRQGEKYNVTTGGTETTLELYTDYLAVPLLVKFYLPVTGFKPNVFFGPSLDIRLRSRATGVEDLPDLPSDTLDTGILASFGTDEDIGDNVNGLDVSLVGGLGFDIAAGPGFIVLEGRAKLGLTDVFDDVVQSSDFRNWGFSVMGGYAIRF